ncbi:helix-turn-helix transcriptional regulator [Roseibium aestuarii]|uniref:Substrate-binding domain-containing protein n=1 Tax=Roseibium aestuarii TaxID=2600299 RepID=A0ABW4JYQ6_9HYPH|nr:helix-turn-helix transcriptional regulator [Roseibium aestuarii]
MDDDLPRYLTTREFADLIRVKERKVYDLVASGDVPHSRATGKLLFPRDAVLAWIERSSDAQLLDGEAPAVMLGSHDPLLEWAIRESRCGLACLFDGSLDGLSRFARHEGVAAGLHVPNEDGSGWNTDRVSSAFGYRPVVLMQWAQRSRGLVLASGNPAGVRDVAGLRGLRVVRRQDSAGSHILFLAALRDAGLEPHDVIMDGPMMRDEREAAQAVFTGEADAAFGLEMAARQSRLDFVPVCRERFDIVISRRDFFEPAFQTLLAFTRTPAFHDKAQALGGYDVTGLGTVHFNGA